MRRILYYIVPLLAMLSCKEQVDLDVVAEGKLATTISVVLPQIPDAYPQSATRAMGMNPQMENLYLAVFDDNGYLLEYVKATDESEMATENETIYKYQVSLTPTDFSTSVHFIGNAPSTLSFGTEVEAVGKLYTEGGAEAYWEKITFPEGIKTNADGTLHASVVDALKDVRLVRNFAWIKLTDSSPNFEIKSYCVINTRTQGTVAPYNTTQSQFADFAHQQTYTDLVNEGYEGFIPAGAELNQTIPDEATWFTVDGKTEDNYAYFIYEREKPTSNPTFILVKGTYTPDGGTPIANRYYKVDLRQGNGDYFPIIRNFRYNVEISNVKHEGHATAAAAVAGAGSGDVSTAIETEDFTNISNNIARIFVNYTDTVLVNQMADLKLRYKFMVFKTEDENGNTTDEQILNGDANVTIELGSFVGGKVIQSWEKATADDDGWREITISTTELSNIRKSEEIIIKGKVTIGEGEHANTYQLQRKVSLTLRPKYDMQLVCDPTAILENLGEPFDLLLKLPGGLGSSMFPLEFQIEAENQSITPNLGDDLPVITGKSIIASKNQKTTIGFIKHIEWSDYDALPNADGYKTIRCHFKSNKAASATAIYVQNKYFNQNSTNLANYTPSSFSNLTFNPTTLPNKVDQNVSFRFTMSKLPSQGYVIVALNNLEPADDETRLTYVGVENGMPCYSFNPTQTTETLKLKNTDVGVEAKVRLSAYHFYDAEETMGYIANKFTDLTFNPSVIINKVNENVAFSFNMTNIPTGDITVALTYFVPSSTETRLTLKKEEGNVKYYAFKPTALNNTLQLQNTASGVTAKVQLSATNFPDAEKTMQISNKCVIPKGLIKLGTRPGNVGRNDKITFSVHSSNSTTNAIITFGNAKWANVTIPDINLDAEQYQAIVNNGGNLYFKFTNKGVTYTATANLETLLAGNTVTLTWK